MNAIDRKEMHISTTSGISGYFAVMYWWNPEGFWEPYQTGLGRYATKPEAEAEARSWAKAEELEFLP